MLWRRRNLLLGCAILMALAAGAGTALIEPRYESQAYFIPTSAPSEFVKTALEQDQERILKETQEQLHLEKTAEYNPALSNLSSRFAQITQRIKQDWSQTFGSTPLALQITKKLDKNTWITPQGGTLIEITAHSIDPARAADLANTIQKIYAKKLADRYKFSQKIEAGQTQRKKVFLQQARPSYTPIPPAIGLTMGEGAIAGLLIGMGLGIWADRRARTKEKRCVRHTLSLQP